MAITDTAFLQDFSNRQTALNAISRLAAMLAQQNRDALQKAHKLDDAGTSAANINAFIDEEVSDGAASGNGALEKLRDQLVTQLNAIDLTIPDLS